MIGTASMIDRSPLLESLYRSTVARVALSSPAGFRLNRTAVSSLFMREILAREYGIDAAVLYPTFSKARPRHNVPWSARPLRFISVGRFSPDKNLIQLVDSYAALHREWPSAEFTIVGKIADERYFGAVCSRAASLGLPLHTVSEVSREELGALLESSKVYVAPKKYEHFGLAVLEAAQAGCLPFVHDSGGQTEIVRPKELHYTSVPELVARVSAMLRDETTRERVLEEVRSGLAASTLEDFFAGLDRLLRPLLDNDHGRDGPRPSSGSS
jgi:glycosyltransferase involved in cell wall biosynthesis